MSKSKDDKHQVWRRKHKFFFLRANGRKRKKHIQILHT
jgi:hypothetical protein